jgi:hypothetical protein
MLLCTVQERDSTHDRASEGKPGADTEHVDTTHDGGSETGDGTSDTNAPPNQDSAEGNGTDNNRTGTRRDVLVSELSRPDSRSGPPLVWHMRPFLVGRFRRRLT